MTETTYKWGEAPGEFKSQKDADKAKREHKARIHRNVTKQGGLKKVASTAARSAVARTFKQANTPGRGVRTHGTMWDKIANSVATRLRQISGAGGRGGRIGAGYAKPSLPGMKTEIPKKLTRNY